MSVAGCGRPAYPLLSSIVIGKTQETSLVLINKDQRQVERQKDKRPQSETFCCSNHSATSHYLPQKLKIPKAMSTNKCRWKAKSKTIGVTEKNKTENNIVYCAIMAKQIQTKSFPNNKSNNNNSNKTAISKWMMKTHFHVEPARKSTAKTALRHRGSNMKVNKPENKSLMKHKSPQKYSPTHLPRQQVSEFR